LTEGVDERAATFTTIDHCQVFFDHTQFGLETRHRLGLHVANRIDGIGPRVAHIETRPLVYDTVTTSIAVLDPTFLDLTACFQL
jgi:hypothetical protein